MRILTIRTRYRKHQDTVNLKCAELEDASFRIVDIKTWKTGLPAFPMLESVILYIESSKVKRKAIRKESISPLV